MNRFLILHNFCKTIVVVGGGLVGSCVFQTPLVVFFRGFIHLIVLLIHTMCVMTTDKHGLFSLRAPLACSTSRAINCSLPSLMPFLVSFVERTARQVKWLLLIRW